MIKLSSKGNFSKIQQHIEQIKNVFNLGILDKYGKEGVEALSNATPVDTGKTAASWHYRIEQSKGTVKLSFYNSNVVDGTPVAMVLEYGHGTKGGGYVEGRDYIKPAIQPVLERLTAEVWKEATKE